MQQTIGRRLLFALIMLTFCCLLLGGGSRLIASPEMEAPQMPLPPVFGASLSCAPAERIQPLDAKKVQVSRPIYLATAFTQEKATVFSLPQTDANGNILRNASYMRAVYQVFVLGDGFA